MLTINQQPIAERVQSPHVWCPISVAQSSRKGEQSTEDLVKLAPVGEWPKRTRKDGDDASSQFDTTEESYSKVWKLGPIAQAIRSQEIDEIGGGEVQVNMLKAQQNGKKQTTQ
jgi:hypothetical protein